MARLKQRRARWLGATILWATLALAACGSTSANTPAGGPRLSTLHEHALLKLISTARTDAAGGNRAGVESTLVDFVADVRSLRTEHGVSGATATWLESEALAAQVQTATEATAATTQAQTTPTQATQTTSTGPEPPAGSTPTVPGAGSTAPGQAKKAADGWLSNAERQVQAWLATQGPGSRNGGPGSRNGPGSQNGRGSQNGAIGGGYP